MTARPLITVLRAALAGLVVLAMPAVVGAQTAEAVSREAVERIVREYLVRNPEVLQEAFTELERRQAEAQKVAQASALRQVRGSLTAGAQIAVGNPQGDITLIEFFDYNCGYCKRALGDIQGLVKSDPKLRVVLKDLPVLGPESVEASRLSLAASQQLSGDKLFEYHAKLLNTRGRVNGERALAVARDLGLDMARLQKDAEGPLVQAALRENSQLAEKLGLNGTPAFIVGEEIIPGAVGQEPLKQAIASARKCGGTSC
jgi:protein-disulfide isomerase